MSSRFASPSLLRKFEIRLKGGTLYVNAHYMAEISPYFHQVCFSEGFTEAASGFVVLDDMDYNEVLILLEFICPDRNYEIKRNITGAPFFTRPTGLSDTNLAALIHCSNRFQIPSLTKDLKHFLEIEIDQPDCQLKAETLVDALLESEFAGYTTFTTRGLYRKLATHGEEAVQLAVKELPTEIATKLLGETAHYLRVLNPLRVRHQSSYHWNDFGKRMFY